MSEAAPKPMTVSQPEVELYAESISSTAGL